MEERISGESARRREKDRADHQASVARANARFQANCALGAHAVFTTDAKDLWGLYLGTFADPAVRQFHDCHCCRRFLERFGAIAIIGDDGTITPAIWNEEDAADRYKPAFAALAKAVRRASVTGVFHCSDAVWGKPEAGSWHHMAVQPLPGMVFSHPTMSAAQAMAEKREDFKNVMHALDEYTHSHLETALTLLKTEALYRSEKVLGQAEWLHALHQTHAAAHGTLKANVVWRAVAEAPAGFCHPRAGMIGTLLEDIAAGKEFSEVARAFAAKMHPLLYQRPQAAPTAGAIAAAETLFERLGAAGALERRFARTDEVKALWRPAPKQAPAPPVGLFGHLKPAGDDSQAMKIPAQTMTWEKFERTVLPSAERIQFMAPAHGDYTALVTAANPDAPPILQWDLEDARNPVSSYVWHGGSTAASFGLRGGEFVDVEAIALTPSKWSGGHDHQGSGVVFILEGARESKNPGAVLFPEILKSEFHGVRSVIEAYSRKATMGGLGEPHAAGVSLYKGSESWDALLRVWSGGRALDYRLDRWD